MNTNLILGEINTIIDFNTTALKVRLSWGNLSDAVDYGKCFFVSSQATTVDSKLALISVVV